MANSKVIHIHFVGKRKDCYFGSVAAIFTMFTQNDIGVTQSYLNHCHLAQGYVVVNSKTIIKQCTLIKASKAK